VPYWYKMGSMDSETVITLLRTHAAELRATGVESLSLFGSTARSEASASSDVDLLVRLRPDFAPPGLAYFGKLSQLRERLAQIVGNDVDLLTEPVRKQALREEIEQDRLRVL
jgi:predicted nucleotidyltransferase